jgi:hypothetical protein
VFTRDYELLHRYITQHDLRHLFHVIVRLPAPYERERERDRDREDISRASSGTNAPLTSLSRQSSSTSGMLSSVENAPSLRRMSSRMSLNNLSSLVEQGNNSTTTTTAAAATAAAGGGAEEQPNTRQRVSMDAQSLTGVLAGSNNNNNSNANGNANASPTSILDSSNGTNSGNVSGKEANSANPYKELNYRQFLELIVALSHYAIRNPYLTAHDRVLNFLEDVIASRKRPTKSYRN